MSVAQPPHTVEVFAPATIANLGVGFDILGLALAEPYDTIYAERVDEPGITITSITGDGGKLPLDPAKNTAGLAPQFFLGQMLIKYLGLPLRIHRRLSLASGQPN